MSGASNTIAKLRFRVRFLLVGGRLDDNPMLEAISRVAVIYTISIHIPLAALLGLSFSFTVTRDSNVAAIAAAGC
jgi:hypothetical protein